LLRGTGIRGLTGIAGQIVKSPDLAIYRPLLRIERSELRHYLNELQQSWREDASNEDPRFFRNRVRKEIIPLLKAESPSVVSLLGRLSEQAVDMQELLDEWTTIALEAALITTNSTNASAVLLLSALPKASILRSETFRLLWRRQSWPMDGMTYDHWKRLAAMIDDKNCSADFPGPLRVTKTERTLILEAKLREV
jgi:hypothetical protein